MIRHIEALGFRCLRSVSQELGRFHVIVGPNASGKTTFLDVIAFLGSLVADGLDAAIDQRTQNFQDLTWARSGDPFELAIELAIPSELREQLKRKNYDAIRYEVGLGFDKDSNRPIFTAETVSLKRSAGAEDPSRQRELFPASHPSPKTILHGSRDSQAQTVISKILSGNDNFYPETYSKKKKDWVLSFKLGPRRSALANLPEDETKFPVSTWLKSILAEGVQQLILNSLLIRRPSPPGRGRHLEPDGSNLPWVVAHLEENHPEKLRDWLAHLRTALPDLEGLRTVERPEDRHRYLMLRYHGGLEIPSWVASDGTLRLLALTLPAYLQGLSGIYLIEEPENGIHPRAVETMFQSLSSVYDAQVLLATHSPVVLGIVDPSALLCFAKDDEGATDIVLGSEHPALQDWRRETNLATLFAAGVLG